MQTPDTSIILKWLSGKASPEEAAMLDDWLNSSPSNAAAFDSVWKEWREMKGKPAYQQPDLALDWKDLQPRIKSPTTPKTNQSPLKNPAASPKVWPYLHGLKIIPLLAGIAAIVGVSTWLVVKHSSASKSGGSSSPASVLSPANEQTVRNQSAVDTGPLPLLKQTGSATLKDTLANGATLVLDRQTTIREPSSANPLILYKGEVFIKTSGQQTSPVVLKTGDWSIHTMDGNFLLARDSSSGNITVQVFKGTLELKDAPNIISLQEGHTFLYEPATRHIAQANAIDTNRIAFATGIFSFHNTSLMEIASILSKAYGTTFRFANPSVSKCRMTVQFDNLPLANVLDIISNILNIRYTLQPDGKEVLITGRGCD